MGTNSPHKLILKAGTMVGTATLYGVIKEVKVREMECTVASIVSSSPTTSISSLVKSRDYPERIKNLIEVLKRYRKAVAIPGKPLGQTESIQHKINISQGTKPLYIPAYRLPHSKKETAKKSIQEMLQQGIIRLSNSP